VVINIVVIGSPVPKQNFQLIVSKEISISDKKKKKENNGIDCNFFFTITPSQIVTLSYICYVKYLLFSGAVMVVFVW